MNLPKKIESLWIGTTGSTQYPSLQNNLETEVLIIGGGIAGLNAAYFLLQKGVKVTLIEAEHIVQSTSGNTTAKVTSLHELKYSYLLKHFGQERAQLYADSNQCAVKKLKDIIKTEEIDCDYHEASAFTYARTDTGLKQVEDEVEACKKLGLPAHFVKVEKEIPFDIQGAIRFDNQAYFHPRKYLLVLAQILQKKGCYLYENTRATQLKEHDTYCEVKTEKGIIKAQKVIVATNYPIYDTGGFFLKMNQMRSYALAVKLKSKLPEGMFISIDDLEISFRPHKSKEGEWLIIGGEDHVAGEDTNAADRFQKLEEAARKRFDILSIDYKWAAQDSSPLDRVPYIGKMPLARHIYVTTGYGEWGMTTSFVSAQLLTDLVTGHKNEWSVLYDPGRVKPIASAGKLVEHGLHVAKGFINHLPFSKANLDDIQPNEGKIITHNGQKLAVYKDKNGKVMALSAVCTHMGCIVDWNTTEKTWDCPCHGSRFETSGKVINGPATKPLSMKELK